MNLYVFVSSAQPSVLGLTIDQTGQNLPDGYGRWERIEPAAITAAQTLERGDGKSPPCASHSRILN
jgi:hypothetical protein